MALERFGGFFGGSHPLRQLFVHQCEADVVLTAVEEVIEPLQLTKKMERAHEEMQLHVRIAVFHTLDGIESGADARGERLLRQPSAAARAVEVFAKLRECPLHRDGKRFSGFTAFNRAFKGFSGLHMGHYSSLEMMLLF